MYAVAYFVYIYQVSKFTVDGQVTCKGKLWVFSAALGLFIFPTVIGITCMYSFTVNEYKMFPFITYALSGPVLMMVMTVTDMKDVHLSAYHAMRGSGRVKGAEGTKDD